MLHMASTGKVGESRRERERAYRMDGKGSVPASPKYLSGAPKIRLWHAGPSAGQRQTWEAVRKSIVAIIHETTNVVFRESIYATVQAGRHFTCSREKTFRFLSSSPDREFDGNSKVAAFVLWL